MNSTTNTVLGLHVGDRKTWMHLLAVFFALEVILIAAVALETYVVYVSVFIICIAIFLAMNSKTPALYLLCLLPLSQPIPVLIGEREIGLYPEYLVLPSLGALMMLTRLKNRNFSFEKTGFVIPFVLFILVGLGSLLHSGTVHGFPKSISGIGLLYVFSLSLLFFALVVEWLKDENAIRRALFVLFVSLIIIALVGIGEYAFGSDDEKGVIRITSLFDTIFWEEGGGNPNSLGTYLMMMLLLAIAVRNSYDGYQRSSITIAILLGIIALTLTWSRSSLAAFVVGAIFLGVKSTRRFLVWLAPIIGVGILASLSIPRVTDRIATIYAIATDPKVIQFFLDIDPRKVDWGYVGYYGLAGYNSDYVSAAMRFPSWIIGLETFFSYPIFGVGPKMSLYYSGMETSENLFLDIAVMTGLCGLLLTLWIFWKVFRLMGSAKKNSLTQFAEGFVNGYAAMIVGLVIVSLTGSVLFALKLMLLFWFFTAILWRVTSTKEMINRQL